MKSQQQTKYVCSSVCSYVCMYNVNTYVNIRKDFFRNSWCLRLHWRREQTRSCQESLATGVLVLRTYGPNGSLQLLLHVSIWAVNRGMHGASSHRCHDLGELDLWSPPNHLLHKGFPVCKARTIQTVPGTLHANTLLLYTGNRSDNRQVVVLEKRIRNCKWNLAWIGQRISWAIIGIPVGNPVGISIGISYHDPTKGTETYQKPGQKPIFSKHPVETHCFRKHVGLKKMANSMTT